MRRLKPKCAMLCERFFNCLKTRSLNVIKNRYIAAVIRIEFRRNFISKFLIISTDNIREIIKYKNKDILFSKSDLIQLSWGPSAIVNKNTTKKGIINLLKKGGPTDIFSDVITSKKIG